MTPKPQPALSTGSGISPFDTAMSSGFRFAVEIIGWVAGPWAAADLTDTAWVAAPAFLVLFGLSALFTTPGDKAQIAIATPGPLRLLVELIVTAAAVSGAWIVWPTWAGVTVSILAGASLVAGTRRLQWLARGAPTVVD